MGLSDQAWIGGVSLVLRFLRRFRARHLMLYAEATRPTASLGTVGPHLHMHVALWKGNSNTVLLFEDRKIELADEHSTPMEQA